MSLRTRIVPLVLLLGACAPEPASDPAPPAEAEGLPAVDAGGAPALDAGPIGVTEAAAPRAVAPTLRYAGRVVDAAGRPVAGVALGTWGSRTGEPCAVSGGDGRFAFEAEPDAAAPRVQDAGFVELLVGHPAGGAGAALVVVAVAEPLHGRVLDAADRPVAGALVQLVPAGPPALPDGFVELRRTSPRRAAHSDADGRFVLPAVPRSAGFALAAEHPEGGVGRATVGDGAREGGEALVVRLGPEGA